MKNDHIIQYPDEYSHCIGCSSCELFCSLSHDGVTGPCHGGIKLELGKLSTLIHKVSVCEHCEDHPCYEACPKKDKAMCVDENGTVYINEAECIGCGLCARACKLTPFSSRYLHTSPTVSNFTNSVNLNPNASSISIDIIIIARESNSRSS